jgi:hypothetical protein
LRLSLSLSLSSSFSLSLSLFFRLFHRLLLSAVNRYATISASCSSTRIRALRCICSRFHQLSSSLVLCHSARLPVSVRPSRLFHSAFSLVCLPSHRSPRSVYSRGY